MEGEMSQNKPLIKIAKGQTVDIYLESGITVGHSLIIQNVYSKESVRLFDQANVEASSSFNTLSIGEYAKSDAGNHGCHIYSQSGATVCVREA